jgi:hypothetical protein
MSYTLENLSCGSDLGVVLDTTSSNIRYGVSGSDAPMGVFPKNDSAEVGAAPVVPSWPITRGKVNDWDRLEKVWTYGFTRSGFNGYDQRIPVGIVTSMASFDGPAKDLEKMSEMLFEMFEVGSTSFQVQPVAGLHASGRTTGVAVSCDYGLTQVMPIFNGVALHKHFPTCAGYMQLGSQDVDSFLLAQAPELDYIDQFQLNQIKQRQCVVPEYSERRLPHHIIAGSTFRDATELKDVELPDGQLVTLSAAAWNCGEILMDPTVGGNLVRMDSDWHSISATGGLATFISQKAGAVPAYHIGSYACGDWRVQLSTCLALKYRYHGQVLEAQVLRELMRNVCVFGDATMMNGLPTRLEQELRALAPPQLDINVSAAEDRDAQPWIGGSLVMSYGSVAGATRASYQEHGPLRIAEAFSIDHNMTLQEDYELIEPSITAFESPFAMDQMGGEGGAPSKDHYSQGMALEFNAKDLSHPESSVQATHPSPLWTPLKFIGAPANTQLVIKVGPALRERPGSNEMTPQHMVDDEDGPEHVFQRAPALQILHKRLEEAGVEVTYRNEPGADKTFKLIFLDSHGAEFFNSSVLSFQGIKQAYARFATLHGSVAGAPPLEDMYENAQSLTLVQLSYFESIDKDPREYIPEDYFLGLEALATAWEACKSHFDL